MRKRLGILIALMLLACRLPALSEGPRIGVCIYNGQDTFILSLAAQIEASAQNRAELVVKDAQNDQNKQSDQISALLEQGIDALIVNPVDRTSAIYLIEMAMRYQVPIVFINREPLKSDMALYDKAYYVGIDPKEQGLLSGRLAADYFLANAQADKNKDGVFQIVILKGEPGHQDAELRTHYSLRALWQLGIPVEILAQDSAMWERNLGQEKMAAYLNAFDGSIECVLSNNDDMALGAIDALKAAGYFADERYMPIMGIDATAPALEALENGTLYGTVMNDALEQGKAAFELALLLSKGEDPQSSAYPYAVVDKTVYVESRVITRSVLDSGNEDARDFAP